MSSQEVFPHLIKVKLTRTPIGVWVAESPDLRGFFAAANTQSSLHSLIGEQIALACRAQGFEVDAGPVGSVDDGVSLWSIKIRNPTPADGPNKVGGTDFLPVGEYLRRDQEPKD
jgi:hypothetical protein